MLFVNRPFRYLGYPFFLSGILTAPPLMLGPPELSPLLLQRATEEHFRYGMLLLATVFFAIGFVSIVAGYWKQFSFPDRLMALLFVICVGLLVWDHVSSYNFPAELRRWIAGGQNPEDFFPGYNFHPLWRTLGRALIYGLVSWLAIMLLRNGVLKRRQVLFLVVFSAIGIVFFLLTNFIGMQFYFPFMVPAVAIAPVYWLGLMLLVNTGRD